MRADLGQGRWEQHLNAEAHNKAAPDCSRRMKEQNIPPCVEACRPPHFHMQRVALASKRAKQMAFQVSHAASRVQSTTDTAEAHCVCMAAAQSNTSMIGCNG